MKNNRQMTASLLFAAAFGLSVFFGFFQAFGALAGPGAAFESEAQKHGYDGETWQRLMDDTLEYEEIQNLVHTFHPEISRAWENYGESVSLTKNNIYTIEGAKREVKDLLERAKETGDVEGILRYTAYEKALSGILKKMNDSLDYAEKKVSLQNAPLRNSEFRVVTALRLLMIQVTAMEENKKVLEETVALREMALGAEEIAYRQGLATKESYERAAAALAGARSDGFALNSSLEALKNSLLLSFGWKSGAQVALGVLPEPDMESFRARSVDEDFRRARGNNYDLIAFRNAGYNKGTTGRNIRRDREEELEGILKISLESLYASALEKSGAYDGAKLGLEAARKEEEGAAHQKRLGLLSDLEYRRILLTRQAKEAALVEARGALLAAVVEYEAAVEGNLALE